MPVPAARRRCGQRARRGMLLVPGVTRFVASVAPRTGRGQRALPFAFSGGEGARWPEEPRHGRCSPRTASPLLFPGTGVVCRPCPSSPHPRGRDPPGPIPPSSPVWGLSAPKRDPGRGGQFFPERRWRGTAAAWRGRSEPPPPPMLSSPSARRLVPRPGEVPARLLPAPPAGPRGTGAGLGPKSVAFSPVPRQSSREGDGLKETVQGS